MVLSGIMLSFLLASCVGPDEGVVVDEVRPLQQEEIIQGDQREESPVADWENLASPSPVDLCKVADGLTPEEIRYSSVRGSVGFPFIPERFPHKGTASIVLAQVAFEDVRPAVDESPLEYFSPHAEKVKQWFEFWSQGEFEVEIEIVPDFVEIPMNSSDLPSGQEAAVDIIMEHMPPSLDFSGVDGTFVYWASPINSRLAGEGALRVGSSENSYGGDEDRPGLFWAAHNWHLEESPGFPYELKRNYTWGYLLHEIQHEQGLNTHAPGNGWSVGSGQNQYPNPRSGQWSAALASWELWLLGWIFDDQVQCLMPDDLLTPQKVILTPQEIFGGERKIAVVPINDADVLVIESRRPINWTEGWDATDAGLMVYTVNPQLREQDDHSSGDCGNSPEYPKWAYYLFPDELEPRECVFNDFQAAILREPGQTITHGEVEISLAHSSDELDYVLISAKK